jgi:hypothetical protein
LSSPNTQKPNTQRPGGYVRLSDFINEENKNKCVKIRGLPYSADVRQIREFFYDFRVAERDIIIDKAGNGQATGYALVFLDN